MASSVGLLLLQLGTPAAPRPAEVRRFLREFLSDPRVLDMPAWKRFLVLELLILPRRPRASAEAYAKIWSSAGSPLLIHARALAEQVRGRLGESVAVELAMRYGEPSIGGALDRFQRDGVGRIVVFPLFAQYSTAATGSAVARVYELAAQRWNTSALQVVPPFFDHPAHLAARAELARPFLASQYDRVFMSFHGLPVRQALKSGATPVFDYRAQCQTTARLLAGRLEIPDDKLVVSFQSRLGRSPWMRPYTDEVLAAQARGGARRAVILSPGFVFDCLETLEELGIRGAETWREHGGESLALVPALNATDRWADAVVEIARDGSSWIPR
jgi:ferrochelatase